MKPPSFDRLYAHVNPYQRESLARFCQQYAPQTIAVNGVTWKFHSLGSGAEAVLFLHGLAGAADIWWQQMLALQPRYRVISVTYPALDRLEDLAQGILTILDREGVRQVNVVGSSLGGYLTQYLLAAHSERVQRAVFGNTYADEKRIKARFGLLGWLAPRVPEWLVMWALRVGDRQLIYPTSQHSPLLLAYLTEQTYGKTTKAQIVCRYQIVIEPFSRPDSLSQVPILILESDNDPLIDPPTQKDLRDAYPQAQVHTFHAAGHFPYLVVPDEYLQVLKDFLAQT